MKADLSMFSLEGKSAIVTGAAKKTGLCYGMVLALHNAGAKVVLMDVIDPVFDLAAELGGEKEGYYAVKCDLCDQASREAGFDKAVELLGGKLDILVKGAGIQYREHTIDFPVDRFEKIIDINLNATFFMAQLAARNMMKHGGGKIINIASMTSFVASTRIPAYAASKGGVMQVTKAMSNEWAEHNINVNAIAPGYMKTMLTADMIETEEGKKHTARIPAGRWGLPEDMAGAIVFLASSASDYVSGAIIPVDGGYLGR